MTNERPTDQINPAQPEKLGLDPSRHDRGFPPISQDPRRVEVGFPSDAVARLRRDMAAGPADPEPSFDDIEEVLAWVDRYVPQWAQCDERAEIGGMKVLVLSGTFPGFEGDPDLIRVNGRPFVPETPAIAEEAIQAEDDEARFGEEGRFASRMCGDGRARVYLGARDNVILTIEGSGDEVDAGSEAERIAARLNARTFSTIDPTPERTHDSSSAIDDEPVPLRGGDHAAWREREEPR